MWLNEDQVAQLTNCRHRQRLVRYRRQVETLRAMGIMHKQRPDGSVAVLVEHVLHMFGGKAKVSAPEEPDWDAVDATRKTRP